MSERRSPDPFALEPFDDTLRALWRPWHWEGKDIAPRIKVDITESDAAYTVTAEIPGVRKEEVDVRIDGNLVTIGAEVKKHKEEKDGDRVLRSERQEGWSSRSFTLACSVDESKAAARYDNGLLTLTLPKRAGEATKRLRIQ